VTVMEQLIEAQERVLADVQSAQSRVVEASQRLAETAGSWAPKVEFPSTDSLPSLGDLPKGEELAASYFEFAGKMLEINRAFVEQMIGVWRPAEVKKSTGRAKAA
jgi:hypothetical protein